jgi:sulfite exporter TauE/SafE
MSVLTRLLGWLLVAGLIVGVVVRVTLGRSRFRALVTLLIAVPAVLHVAYAVFQALGHGASVLGALAYLVGATVTVAAGALFARRWVQERPLWAALAPVATGAAYGLLPFGLYSWALRRAAIDLDIVPTAVYVGACLFGTALLLAFVPGAGGPPTGRWRRSLQRLVRRR